MFISILLLNGCFFQIFYRWQSRYIRAGYEENTATSEAKLMKSWMLLNPVDSQLKDLFLALLAALRAASFFFFFYIQAHITCTCYTFIIAWVSETLQMTESRVRGQLQYMLCIYTQTVYFYGLKISFLEYFVFDLCINSTCVMNCMCVLC